MALWGGRFSTQPEGAAFALSRSIDFDWRLAPYDLRSSLAHLDVLQAGGLISPPDTKRIAAALRELIQEVTAGKFLPRDSDEDVHSALERALVEKLGVLGGALRAGRSRNDQVATDLRLYAIDHMLHLAHLITDLQRALTQQALTYSDAPAPGFTHLQHAQPIVFGHELAKHAHALGRDLDRIKNWQESTSLSPLGAGALSGSSLPLDPIASAKALGFRAPMENSIDAVSDRDFVAEAIFICAMVGSHLSRMGEEWCLWASTEFGWAKIDDAFATGSSIMPQKKNPDIAELARGKSARLIGNLTSVLAMLKGLPFAYNRDLQEDKEPLFDSLDTLNLLLPAMTGLVATTSWDRAIMAASAPTGFSLATEIADYLVRNNVAFAQAHEAAGQCVRECEKTGIGLHELNDAQLQSIHPALKSDIRALLTADGAVQSRTTYGATSTVAVRKQIATLNEKISKDQSWVQTKSAAFSGMMSQ